MAHLMAEEEVLHHREAKALAHPVAAPHAINSPPRQMVHLLVVDVSPLFQTSAAVHPVGPPATFIIPARAMAPPLGILAVLISLVQVVAPLVAKEGTTLRPPSVLVHPEQVTRLSAVIYQARAIHLQVAVVGGPIYQAGPRVQVARALRAPVFPPRMMAHQEAAVREARVLQAKAHLEAEATLCQARPTGHPVVVAGTLLSPIRLMVHPMAKSTPYLTKAVFHLRAVTVISLVLKCPHPVAEALAVMLTEEVLLWDSEGQIANQVHPVKR